MEFFQESSIWVYLFIFLGKILEVTVSIVRIVLINRGERVKGSIIALFEMSLWLFITGTVLAGFQNDFKRVLIFAAAFAVGNYLGSWLEDKLAFGLCSVQVIATENKESQKLVSLLRERNFAVTVLSGKGKDGDRELMVLHIKRKRIKEAVELIKTNLEQAVIVVNDTKVMHGGFIKK
jgi:uncharacterized protein YebE (UPF0316 family)